MSDKEILLKSIKQAIKHHCSVNSIDIDVDYWIKHKFYYAIIFDHEFLQCFFSQHYDWNIYDWKYHAQQIVLYENPLEYLRKFLDEGDFNE